MITKAVGEQIFMILSSKLDKEEAEGLTMDVITLIIEEYIKILEYEISVNNIHLQHDKMKKGLNDEDMYLYYRGVRKTLAIKNETLQEKINKNKDLLIEILKR